MRQRSSRSIGYLLPVRSCRSLNVQPCRSSSRCPCPRKRLRERSSPGVRPSYTVCPEASANGLSTKGTSLGVPSPLQRSRRRESTSRPVARPGSPGVTQGIRQRVPPRQLRCRSQVFPTSQRTCSSPRPPAIFRQVALMGLCPSGDCSFFAAPATRRHRHTLLAFLPRIALIPVPRRGHPWAHRPLPRMSRPMPLIAFRVFVRKEIDPR